MNNVKPHDPRTKTSIILGHMAAGDLRNAIRVAARLPRLDKHRCAILDAQGAYENPGFYAQIGKDAATLIEAGTAALRERFGHDKESTTMTIELKNYSNSSNARRAAKAAGLSEFDVYKGTDGWYKIRAAAAKAAKAAKPEKAAKPRQMVDESARDSRKLAKLDPWRADAKRINDTMTKDKSGKTLGKRAAVLAAAEAGKLPPPPDFSAPTHARYRDAAAGLVDMAKAGDTEGLKATKIKAYSSSPKAMAKYRDLAVIALEARRAAEPEATAA